MRRTMLAAIFVLVPPAPCLTAAAATSAWVLRASAQVPLSQSGLNGEQDEATVLNVGVTKVFKE